MVCFGSRRLCCCGPAVCIILVCNSSCRLCNWAKNAEGSVGGPERKGKACSCCLNPMSLSLALSVLLCRRSAVWHGMLLPLRMSSMLPGWLCRLSLLWLKWCKPCRSYWNLARNRTRSRIVATNCAGLAA